MNQTQLKSMQRLPGKSLQGGIEASSLAIHWITHQRVADMRHMDSNLVRPPGFELAAYECALVKTTLNRIMRYRLSPLAHHRHAGTLAGVPTNRRIHGTTRRKLSMRQSQILTAD